MTSRKSADYQYQVGGSLPPNASSYVQRQADEAFYQALRQGELSYVLSSRQMGKSSLRVRTMQRLQQEGIRCGVLDMTMFGTRAITATQWYASIVRWLIRSFELPLDFREWWQVRSDLSPVRRLGEFLADELLVHVRSPIVLFIDEIDATLQLDFPADDFFALIRAFYNNRADNPVYRRLSFALIGVAIPSDLIKNPQTTPFNIGKSIVLKGFEWYEAAPLLRGLQGLVENPEAILAAVLTWSGGQPFLTQKICRLIRVQQQQRTDERDAKKEKTESDIKSVDVEKFIKTNIIDNWEVQDQPEHLKTVKTSLLCNPLVAGQLLGLYQRLLDAESIVTDGSLSQVMLRLSGVAVDIHGELKIANPIYREIFNNNWVSNQLQDLRPYAESINHWSASEGQDKTYLLRGLALKSALDWAESKRLSDLDYRFLSASQEAEQQALAEDLVHEAAEREQAEFALTVAIDAMQLLEKTRQQARGQVVSLRNMGRWLAGVMIAVTSLVGITRFSGGLQRLEWSLFDQFFRWRPPTAIESRVVIITIDEPDIQAIGFPISDGILAEAINRVKQHQPRLIGLDIYRDRSVEPGHDDLVSVFQQTPNLVGIEKAVQPSILPPGELAKANQIGFADQLLDSDGVIRRALLAIEDGTGSVKLSFPLKLASLYLEEEGYLAKEGMAFQPIPQNPDFTRLGGRVIRSFRAYDGGYVRADAGGTQILLNYTGTQTQFSTFSLTQVLANEVPERALRDRIVLIGSTASTVNDVHITPYTNRLSGYMSGVMVHANTLSSLLSMVLEDRPLMRVWPKSVEIIWIFIWTATGVLIAGRWRRTPQRSLMVMAIATGGLVISTYGLFLLGWWVPVLPAALGLLLAAVSVPMTTGRQLERLILEHMTTALARHARHSPAVGRIAIAYFKKSESQKNQAWIDSTLNKTEQLLEHDHKTTEINP